MEFIDGHAVIAHQVRFRLRTDISERYVDAVRDGDTIVWLVRSRCLPPQYFPTAKDSDDRYKLAVQDVENAVPLTGAQREAALSYLDHGSDQLLLPFDPPQPNDEIAELHAWLADIGDLREGESVLQTFQRLFAARPETKEAPEQNVLPDSDYLAAVERATAVLREGEPAAPVAVEPDPFPTNDVEVVGSIYRDGRRSNLSDDLTRQFEGMH